MLSCSAIFLALRQDIFGIHVNVSTRLSGDVNNNCEFIGRSDVELRLQKLLIKF